MSILPSRFLVSAAGLWLGLAGLLLSGPALAQGRIEPELERHLQSVQGDPLVPVVIRLRRSRPLRRVLRADGRVDRRRLVRDMKDEAELSSRALRRLLRRHGIQREDDLWMLNGLATRVPASLVDVIRRLPGVASVQLDYVLQVPREELRPPRDPEAPGVVRPQGGIGSRSLAAVSPLGLPTGGSPVEANLALVGAPQLWNLGITGTGIVIGSLDSGVDAAHPDLATRFRGGTNSWYDPFGEHPVIPYDATGHGTQAMGIMLGGDASGRFIGMAPDARWIAAKIFNDAGQAPISKIHLAYQWMLDPDGNPATNDAPDVVNNSWGFNSNIDQCLTEFQPDIQALRNAGIAVVFSAGNQGPNSATSISPANNNNAFAAGAVDNAMNIANFSSRGPSTCDGAVFPEVTAPGVSVKSSDLSFGGMARYATVSGTSFAAPHVSGAIALLRSAFPGKPLADIENALMLKARDLGVPGPDNLFGAGLIDVKASYDFLHCSGGTDTDGDGVPDICDNCTQLSNPQQIDTDQDGYGNRCDADFNQNQVVDIGDIYSFIGMIGTNNANGDFNNNGVVDIGDIYAFIDLIGKPPGPSALVP